MYARIMHPEVIRNAVYDYQLTAGFPSEKVSI